MDRLEKAMSAAKRNGKYGALIFIDLDNFKLLNDTMGHDKGDELLIEVAARLKNCVRDSDTVSRLGGDEFVLMLEDLHRLSIEAEAFARTVGSKILEALDFTQEFNGHQQRTTPSIGITLFNQESESLQCILKQADSAMYISKNAGRNTMSFYENCAAND